MLLVLFAVGSVAVPSATKSQGSSARPPKRSVLWHEIRAVNDSMQEAFGRGDMAAVASFYADDATIAASNETVAGRTAIDGYWRRVGSTPGIWRLEVLAVGGGSQLAYQHGRSHLLQRDAAGRERVSEVDFVVIWRRHADGGWRILLDLY